MSPAKKDPLVYCRYTGKYLRCTGEAVDPIGEVLLCTTHLAMALELVQRHGLTLIRLQAEAAK